MLYNRFNEVDLTDSFFDDLKESYQEFSNWFLRKSNEKAYVFYNDQTSALEGFLYLKIEEGCNEDVNPPLPPLRRLKVGTFKIVAHGTKLGDRFIKKIFDHAIYENVEEIYVTIFEKHQRLISLLEKYGFSQNGYKETKNGIERVYIKKILGNFRDTISSYPLVNVSNKNIYILAIYPKYHTQLFPDSILNNESPDIIHDVSHSNSIHKIYLANMKGMSSLKSGDVLLIYRTTDRPNQARYRAVVTSICVVEECRHISSFESMKLFLDYCSPYSVFSNDELNTFWSKKKYPYVIRFTYNLAMRKKIIREKLLDMGIIKEKDYAGFVSITTEDFYKIIKEGHVCENIIVN